MGSSRSPFPARRLRSPEAKGLPPAPSQSRHLAGGGAALINSAHQQRSSVVVVLEGSDAARVQRQVKDIAQSPLPILDQSLHPDRFYWGPNLHCRVCSCKNRASMFILCDQCNEGYHIRCLEPPLMRVPRGSWECPRHLGTYGLTI